MKEEEIKRFMAMVDPTIKWEAKHTFYTNKFVRDELPGRTVEDIEYALYCSVSKALLKLDKIPEHPKAWTKQVMRYGIIDTARHLKTAKKNFGKKPLSLDVETDKENEKD